jgi:hypothetical protein
MTLMLKRGVLLKRRVLLKRGRNRPPQIWLRVGTLATKVAGTPAASIPATRRCSRWGLNAGPVEKARTLDEPIIAASPVVFRFSASANYACACFRALRV